MIKKVITVLMLAMAFSVTAFSQSQNEGYVGYSFLSQNVQFNKTSALKYNEDTDSHGITAGFSRYTKGENGKAGVFGVTADLTANFDTNRATLITAMAGVTAKARNETFVQPYARALVGIGSQSFTRVTLHDNNTVSAAFGVGAGIDWKVSTFSVRTGVDYTNTGFQGERQNSGRANIAVVF
jgi:hypothetical protein